ncbi:hypothetical protein CISG_01419 [Coccidioides immitis RMSCC 3703]|uniref:Uncharacterized protein n=1 Tax=Coccidioides immitis RMSCC 3703 TaxID=454286 RepID=A0A0J8TV07_COCIT|nr:hypothetical protein CISG_01419 [Coccidioides immitis RMSCC 3703]
MIFAFRGQDHPVFAAQHRPSELAGMTTSARQRTSSYAEPALALSLSPIPAVSVPNSAQASESPLREGPGSREKRETGRWRRRHGGGEMEREESGKEEGKVWWLKQREEQDSTLYSCSAHAQARRGRQVHHARTGLAEQD